MPYPLQMHAATLIYVVLMRRGFDTSSYGAGGFQKKMRCSSQRTTR